MTMGRREEIERGELDGEILSEIPTGEDND
jgi:hypothetical protein